ncbi:MAG TPA: AAA domain-containing protein [Polyangiaceae bacterium]|nr:AAA domain-containing protein [Polyangiaceae bacterium]
MSFNDRSPRESSFSANRDSAVPTLEAREAGEVFRYWGTLLKYQDALARRPRARKPTPADSTRTLDLLQPEPGQEYTKLPFAGAETFLVDQGPLGELAMDAERSLFFEDWLHARYRRSEEEESPVSELVMFPVVHLARGELSGLLRFPARIEWLTERGVFRPLTYEERSPKRVANLTVSPPVRLRVHSGDRDPEQTLPFFLDVSLLSRTLRVESEAIEAFFAELRRQGALTPRAMLKQVCDFLERTETGSGARAREPDVGKPPSGDSAVDCLERLYRAVARRCAGAGRNRCYPVAILVNNQRSRATFHVQRDLAEASERLTNGELPAESPLTIYMTGRSPGLRAQPCYGRWNRAPLTDSQRTALELALGSPFCAVQGPPGTGKTTLILNAVVEQWVQSLHELARSGRPAERFLLVTSTNNRAVDNVVEPLSSGALADCPLALRLGSREVTATQTRATLERVLAFVERQANEAALDVEQARERFRSCYTEIERKFAPQRLVQQQEGEVGAIDRELADLSKAARASANALASALSKLTAPSVSPTSENQASDNPRVLDAASLHVEVQNTLRALGRLSRDTESDLPEIRARFETGYRRLHNKRLKALSQCFERRIDLGLPSPEAVRALTSEACETLLENAVSKLLDLESALRSEQQDQERTERRAEIEQRSKRARAELAELKVRAADPPEPSELAPLSAALFDAALALRLSWVQRNRKELAESLRAAITACERQRSLRVLLDSRSGAGSHLRALFPAFGCTLLSIGNAFGQETSTFDRVIIDEAGQCHAAYAVSALLRARSAIVLGDTHQLEPVVGLNREDERRISRSLKLRIAEAKLQPFRMYDESGNSAQSLAERCTTQEGISERPTLRDHFRCQPEIAALCEAWCQYGMISRTPRSSKSSFAPELRAPVLFSAVAGQQERSMGSYVNRAELEVVTRWVEYLFRAGVPAAELGVLTPYRGQLIALLDAFRARGIPVERPDEEPDENLNLFGTQPDGGVAVGTVHRFQGGERSIIIFSTAITEPASLGFLDARVHLLNVAASRAREHLLVFGHAATLAAGRHTRELVRAGQPLPRLPYD